MARSGSRRERERRERRAKRHAPALGLAEAALADRIVSVGPAAEARGRDDLPLPRVPGARLEDFLPSRHLEGRDGGLTITLPPVALVKVSEIARAENLELALAEDVEARLDAHGIHQLLDVSRVTAPGGADFVRCRARLMLAENAERSRADGRVVAYEIFLDVPTRYVGMMVEAQRGGGPGRAHRRHPEPPPRWAGSWSFDKAFAASRAQGENMETQAVPHPAHVLGAAMVTSLRDAHVLVIDPEQVAVLPEWEGWENLWDYTADAELPFDPLYLDLEGPGGVAPRMTQEISVVRGSDGTEKMKYPSAGTIRGALVYRLGASNGVLSGCLAVDPVGEMWFGEEEAPEPRYEVMGRVIFNHPEPEVVPEGRVGKTPLTYYGFDGRLRDEVEAGCLRASDVTGAPTPGFVVLPVSAADVDDPEAAWAARAVAAVVLSCASRVMAALSITESEVVVIDEADLDHGQRHRAEKRGWPIADKVYIRPTRKGGAHNVTGEEAHYSHRFWVRGHTKHFPLGTQMADARPDLVKACTRGGDASCGFCRRVWTPPFVKGPDDKPLVLKSLVKKKAAA